MPEWSHRVATPAGELVTVPLHRVGMADLDQVFGERGTARHCYCTYWRRPDGGFGDQRDNREHFADMVDDDRPPGLIGYVEGAPVAWVSVGPRSDFPAVMRSRLLRPVDDLEPWVINCFVVRTGWRRSGIGEGMLEAAIRYAEDQGAEMIEAYPVDGVRSSVVDYYTGTMGMFQRHDFTEVLRRNPTRPIVRRERGSPDR